MKQAEQPSLQDIALGIHGGTIYSTLHMMAVDRDPERVARDAGMVFMPLALMNRELVESVNKFMRDCDMPQVVPVEPGLPADLGMIWEYMSKAGPRSVNGVPMFMSMRFLSKDDTLKVTKMIARLRVKDEAVTPEEKAHNELLFWRGE
jgi:hypothetical protein